MARALINFDSIRWPIDIVVFVLAFGYGVTRFLDLLNPCPPLEASRLCAYVCLAFLSTLVVRRYLPSETRLEPHGNLLMISWVPLSLVLAVVMPAIAIYYSGSAFFWILLVASTAAKSILALESHRPKEKEEPHTAHLRRKGVSFSERYLFAFEPDAYELRAVPTAILLTAGGFGVILALRAHSLAERLAGMAIMVCSNWFFVDLSGKARMSAIDRSARAQIDAIRRASEDAAQQGVQPGGH